jgi:hypothetical protein
MMYLACEDFVLRRYIPSPKDNEFQRERERDHLGETVIFYSLEIFSLES